MDVAQRERERERENALEGSNRFSTRKKRTKKKKKQLYTSACCAGVVLKACRDHFSYKEAIWTEFIGVKIYCGSIANIGGQTS
jgi:hypothetical protein